MVWSRVSQIWDIEKKDWQEEQVEAIFDSTEPRGERKVCVACSTREVILKKSSCCVGNGW